MLTSTMKSTDARKEWSSVIDSVVREKPKFITRTRDTLCLSSTETMLQLLSAYQFTAQKFIEDDNSVTLSLNEIDLVENASTEDDAIKKLADSILEYAIDYYNDFSYWSNTVNRKQHIPYVMKALMMNDIKELGDSIICQSGEN